MKANPKSPWATAYLDKDFAFQDGRHQVDQLILIGWLLCTHWSDETQSRELWHIVNPELNETVFTDDNDWEAGALSDFYMIFLDEKDSSAAKGGLAVTHIALIVGCAFPLWASQLLHPTDTQDAFLALLPFLGVVVLGIGDSAGAIGGISFGHYHWSGGSSR